MRQGDLQGALLWVKEQAGEPEVKQAVHGLADGVARSILAHRPT
ncbi:hypothetical protein [Paenibacillus sp. NPDC093718]